MLKLFLTGIFTLVLMPFSGAISSEAKSPDEPDMIPIPAGSLVFGCVPGRDDKVVVCPRGEPPKKHKINAFKLSKTETTFQFWDACVSDKACKKLPDEGWGRDKHPAIHVRWDDTQQFIGWLNKKTGKQYRLPTEVEWEYAARGGTEDTYPWGNGTDCKHANYGHSQCKTLATKPVASYSPNAFGLHDMIGNVAEWTQDCWNSKDNCGETNHILRGCSWMNHRNLCRISLRLAMVPGLRPNGIGFRLALD